MPNLGGWEWVIILVIVLLVFGIGRVGKLGEELGKGVLELRIFSNPRDSIIKGTLRGCLFGL